VDPTAPNPFQERALGHHRGNSSNAAAEILPSRPTSNTPASQGFLGGTFEDVQYLLGHADARTTRLYDRRQKPVTRNIVERISL
jgi:integrase